MALQEVDQKVFLCSFADPSIKFVFRRMRRQSSEFGVFQKLFLYSKNDLDQEFLEEFQAVLNKRVRGFGFYVWKPQIILQALEMITDGDVLVYVDGGSHLDARGKSRLLAYIDICKTSKSGILAFQLQQLEMSWTKAETLNHFGVSNDRQITHSGQVQAGLLIIEKRDQSIRIFEQWLEAYRTDFSLVDDSTREKQHPDFIEHRHDQSIFSILAKLNKIDLLSASEQETQDHHLAEAEYWPPVHHKRDKSSTFAKLLRILLWAIVPEGGRLRKLVRQLQRRYYVIKGAMFEWFETFRKT